MDISGHDMLSWLDLPNSFVSFSTVPKRKQTRPLPRCVSPAEQEGKGKKYCFRDIHNFSFSAKIQDGCQKWQKLNFFSCATLRVKNLLEIAVTVSLTIFEIFSIIYFPRKSEIAAKSGEN